MSSPADLAVAPGAPAGSGTGLWLHGVVRGSDVPALAGLAGLGDGPPRVVPAAGLAAVVSAVPLDEYGAAALEGNLTDLDWLGRVARIHHAVVAALAGTGPVVPARLATVYHDQDRIRGLLADRRSEFLATLDRLRGRIEWGVKGYLVPGTGRAASAETAGSGGAGAAYLRRRRAELASRDEGLRTAARDAAAVHEALAAAVVAARRHPPQDRRLTGADTTMVLNGAYLVDTAQAAEFTGLVEALTGRYPAVRLSLTGPWPPYSFVGTDQPEPGPGGVDR